MPQRFLRNLFLVLVCLHAVAQHPAVPDTAWPTYGGDPGGERYSSATQIDKSNVNRLQIAWTAHTGTARDPRGAKFPAAFEATPILFNDTLYLATPFDQVFALNPATGAAAWKYDPHLDWGRNLGIITSRGVAAWSSHDSGTGICANRIFLGTLDARLIALDAATGVPCADFGSKGSIDLTQNVDYRHGDDYAITSPPTVVGDVVVVGAGIEDNLRVDIELGDVRGFDVRTGKLLWTWEPIPWAKHQTLRTGGANTWGVMAADLEHHLIYLPTSSPSPDYYGGLRPGDNRDADSIVAVDTLTGKKVWAYQIVHHNIWDYDLAAEPLLFTFRGTTPAVAVSTKMGLVFVFNRLTGEPLYPIHERPVPQSDVPGELSSPTQPFPDLPPLSPLTLDLSGKIGLDPRDDGACRKLTAGLRYEGIYTPPSLRGTILFPSNVGGVNWGSTALDPQTGILYANTNRWPYAVKLQKRSFLSYLQLMVVICAGFVLLAIVLLAVVFRYGGKWPAALVALVLIALAVPWIRDPHGLLMRISSPKWLDTGGVVSAHFGKEFGADTGSPYTLIRQPILSPYTGQACGPMPWGTVSALNLNTGKTAWETPLGTKFPGKQTGTLNVGGPIVTAGGLVFTTASQQPLLRAFDSATGEEVWQGKMAVPSQATPMTYVFHGRQYIVVADGGHGAFGTAESDGVLAFALP